MTFYKLPKEFPKTRISHSGGTSALGCPLSACTKMSMLRIKNRRHAKHPIDSICPSDTGDVWRLDVQHLYMINRGTVWQQTLTKKAEKNKQDRIDKVVKGRLVSIQYSMCCYILFPSLLSSPLPLPEKHQKVKFLLKFTVLCTQ
jgi:hypothetical protein